MKQPAQRAQPFKGPIVTRRYLEDLAVQVMLEPVSGAAGILEVGLRNKTYYFDKQDKVYRIGGWLQ